jgi:hypothetical protein
MSVFVIGNEIGWAPDMIRARDAGAAAQYLRDGERIVHEWSDKVGNAMGVPEHDGRHPSALTLWAHAQMTRLGT